MKKVMFLVLSLMILSVPAFAEYGYHYNKYGTGYYRDDSNDGNEYNNANYNDMNDRPRRIARQGQLGRVD